MSTHTIEAILTAKDQGFSSTLDKADGKVESFGEKLKKGLGFGAWMEIGRRAVNTVFNTISSSMDGAINRFDTLNNYPKVLVSLGYSAEEAEKGINDLANGIDHLPTTLDAVASQSQQFVPMTKSVEKATELTLALNNAMASGGKSAEQQQNAIAQWTKAMAKGKPDFEMWQSMVQTAPAQMDQLAKSMLGASATQNDLYEAMKSGKVTIEQVNEAMIDLSKNGGDGFASWEEQAKNASSGIKLAMVNVKASVQRNIANVMQTIDKILEPLGGISGTIQKIIPIINSVGEAISNILSGDLSLGDAIEQMLATLGEKAKEFIPKGAEFIINLIGGIAQQIPQMIVAGLDAITAMVEGLDSGDGKLVSKALSMGVKIAKAFIKAIPALIQAGMKLIGALLKGIIDAFVQVVTKCVNFGKRIVSAIKEGASNLFNIGRQMIEGLWNGIKNKFDSVVGKVKALAQKLPTAVKKVLGIASPSKVFMSIGSYVGEGLAMGIEKSQKWVEVATLGLVNTPSAKMGGLAMDGAYEYGISTRQEIIVPLYINGREFARATAGDMTTEINRREVRQSRMRGVK